MFEWVKTILNPQPAGPAVSLRELSASDATINQDVVSVEDEGWCLASLDGESIHLFEVEDPGVEKCMLTYRAKMKSDDVSGRAYLEMWCRFPGRGEFFSKGLDNAIKGTNDWATYETPFYLNTGQKPDLIKLSVVIEGEGNVWMKDIELTSTPLK